MESENKELFQFINQQNERSIISQPGKYVPPKNEKIQNNPEKKDGGKPPGKGIRIDNLPTETTKQDVENLAKCCGEVDCVILPSDYTTGKTLGHAYVYFKDSKAVNIACQLIDRHVYSSSILSVNCLIKK